MWTHNATWGISAGTGEGQPRLPWLMMVGGVMGVMAVVTVILNVFLLASILCDSLTRSRSFHMHILNMAAAAILQGAGVLPLWTHYLLQGTWVHGDAVCRWWLAADTMASSVSAFAIIVTACDRFIYLLCWRFVAEGGKYVTSFLLLFLSWLLALTLTLILTLFEIDTITISRIGVQSGGQCTWGHGKGDRVVAARLVVYALGAGLGTGLCLALITLPCLGRGDLLPIDEDESEMEVRRMALLSEEQRKRLTESHVATSPIEVETEEENEEDFPHFTIIKKTDRLEERDRWKWQVTSLLTVTLVWVVLWFPSHLIVFADSVGLNWNIPYGAVVGCIVAGYSHAAIMPFLWLLHQPIRSAMANLLFCRCCRREEDEDLDSVEFQDIGPYRHNEVTS